MKYSTQDTETMNKKKKLKAIFQGWKNLFFQDEEVEKIAKERAPICASCEHSVFGTYENLIGDELVEIKGMKCNICHCPLSTLLRQSLKGCELNKWQD